MSARIKKLFHRTKQHEPAQEDQASRQQQHQQQQEAQLEPPQPARRLRVAGSDPALRRSPYHEAYQSRGPERGQYPIRGKGGSSLDLSSRNRVDQPSRSDFPYPSFDTRQGGRTMSTARPGTPPGAGMATTQPYSAPQPDRNMVGRSMGEGRTRRPEADLTQEFADLNLGRHNAARSPRQPNMPPNAYEESDQNRNDDVVNRNLSGQSKTDTGYSQLPSRSDLYGEDKLRHGMKDTTRAPESLRTIGEPGQLMPRNNAGARPIGDGVGYRNTNDQYSPAARYDPVDYQSNADNSASRRTSIQRKQVGSSPTIPSEFTATHAGTQKPVPTSSQETRTIRHVPANDGSSLRPLKNYVPGARDGQLGAEDVVNRARSNTYDTEVIEKIAPAVVHETVNQDVHYLREEVITREIHTDDIYHRILPVIDVEVLPARHFLPVEGGGLVEVNAEDVPGRGKNWVIAETASKIPSDEAAPRTRDRFTAREFPGEEGDTKTYITPEGIQRTEETWVHPPELEKGGYATGQTWPMEFGKPEKKSHHSASSGKSPRKPRSAMKHSTSRSIDGQSGAGATYM